MSKNTTNAASLNYPFPTTAPMTLLGLAQQVLAAEHLGAPAEGNWDNNNKDSNEQRRGLSTILTSVLEILDDEEDFSLGEMGFQGQGATSGEQKSAPGQ